MISINLTQSVPAKSFTPHSQRLKALNIIIFQQYKQYVIDKNSQEDQIMDLGFGSSNQQIGSTATSAILAATSAQEESLVAQISKYDALLDANDSELEALREKRLAQLKLKQEQQLQWRAAGHGIYTELVDGSSSAGQGDVAKAFFEAAKTSSRLVVHFYRNTTRSCDAFHRALSELASKHLETKFIKIDVEGCDDSRESGSGVGAKFLVEKLGIVVMPTILIVLDRKATHHIRGFDELGGSEEFTVNELAFVLGGHGALTRQQEEEMAVPGTNSGRDGRRAGSGGGGSIGDGGGSNRGSLRSKYCYGSRGERGPRSGGYDDFDDE